MLLSSIDVTKATGNTFEHTFGISHVVIAEERALRSDVCKGNNRSPLAYCVQLFGYLKHFVKRNGRNVKGLLQIVVVEVVVGAVLTNVGAHCNGVEYKIYFSTQFLLCFCKHILQVGNVCGVSGDDWSVKLLAKFVKATHTQSCGGIAECYSCSFFYCLYGNFPSDRLIVESSKDDATLAFQ